MFTVFVCPGTPEGSTGGDSGFKASQKTGQWLQVLYVICVFVAVFLGCTSTGRVG